MNKAKFIILTAALLSVTSVFARYYTLNDMKNFSPYVCYTEGMFAEAVVTLNEDPRDQNSCWYNGVGCSYPLKVTFKGKINDYQNHGQPLSFVAYYNNDGSLGYHTRYGAKRFGNYHGVPTYSTSTYRNHNAFYPQWRFSGGCFAL